MPTNTKRKHRWEFAPRFRKAAFGWHSQPAIARIQEALSEIKKETRKDPILGAEGAVLLLEKLSPALMHVDSSSGAIGQTVYNAIDQLAQIIAEAPADNAQRDAWLERLSQAVENDDIPYLEHVPDHWGDLCATSERASRYADEFLPIMRIVWGPDRKSVEYFKWISACLSCLFKAGRFEELLDLLNMMPHKSAWHDRQWGVKALVAMGKSKEALEYAENSRGLNDSPMRIAIACESILLSSDRADEAYQQYAFEANRKPTYLATFRAIAEKSRRKSPSRFYAISLRTLPAKKGNGLLPLHPSDFTTMLLRLSANRPAIRKHSSGPPRRWRPRSRTSQWKQD